MTKKEFNLTKKIIFNGLNTELPGDWRDEDHAVIQRSDVREFIKLLRVGFFGCPCDCCKLQREKIKKLAGKELSEVKL